MTKRIHWSVLLCLVLALLCFAACIEPEQKGGDLSPSLAPSSSPETIGEQTISIVTEPPVSDEQKAEMVSILRRATFLEGTSINGVAIGGMTIDAAKAAVGEALASAKAAFSVSVTDGENNIAFTGETIELTDDLDKVLDEAFDLVREDIGYEEVMAEVERIRTAGKPFEVTVSFEKESLQKAVEAYAEEHDKPAVNASVSYNKETNKVEYTDDVPGTVVDREALVETLLSAKSGESISAPITEQPAEITRDNVEGKYVLRGTKTTSFKGSNNNRKYNIRKGAELMTGTVLHPGEVFSCNDKLGKRTKANGWKLAGAYQSGETVQEYGGGVCQLSSTLYNAAVLADLEIVDRRNHSMKVSYISEGLDATINSVGNIIDFKFKNSSKADILIVAYTNGNDLTFEIYGIPISEDSNGEYDTIKIPKPKKLRTISPSGEKETVVDESKPAGYREESKKRQNGSVWQSYKQYYKGDELVREEELATSTYKAFAGQIIVGPDATAAPDPDPTDKPTAKPSDPDPTEKPTEKPSDPDPTEKPTEKPTEPDPTPVPVTPEPVTPEPVTPEPVTPQPTKAPDPTENPGGGEGGEGGGE